MDGVDEANALVTVCDSEDKHAGSEGSGGDVISAHAIFIRPRLFFGIPSVTRSCGYWRKRLKAKYLIVLGMAACGSPTWPECVPRPEEGVSCADAPLAPTPSYHVALVPWENPTTLRISFLKGPERSITWSMETSADRARWRLIGAGHIVDPGNVLMLRFTSKLDRYVRVRINSTYQLCDKEDRYRCSP